MHMQDYEFWFVVGSQFLYGPEVLETVAKRAAEMTEVLNASGNLPCKIVYKVTAKTNKEIAEAIEKQYGVAVDKKKVNAGEIKAFGSYTAEVKLYTGISAKMGVEVGE